VRLSRRSHDAGFTLVEVLTAVSILGIVTAVAATNFTAMLPAFRARGAALLVAGDLNQARMWAVHDALIYDYFPLAGGYQIRRDDGVGGRVVIKQVLLSAEYPTVQFGYTGITKDPYNANIAGAAPTAAMTFDSNGTVQNATNIFLQAPNGTQYDQEAVTLSAAGRVRVWKYDATAWH